MLTALTDIRHDITGVESQMRQLRVENARLQSENARLGTENGRLRTENRSLRTTRDAYAHRAGCSGLFGPLELTAGTCIGPRRRQAGSDT